MRAFAMTGMLTASMMLQTSSGALILATPPWARMSAGTRSSAITAQAPASSAIRACSGVTTSMITPPFSISARPVLTRKVARSLTIRILRGVTGDRSRLPLLQLVGADAIFVGVFVTGVEAVGQGLDESHQRGVGAREGRTVRRVIERQLGVLSRL